MALDLVIGGDLPLPVGSGMSIGVPPSDVDVLVGRVPFWLSIGQNTPYQRETADFQRQQFDNQPEAGEQTLAGWWTRSQMSFHCGAGLDYLDTAQRPQPEDRFRYKSSRNVDVWTPSQVSRLNATAVSRAATAGEKVWVDQAAGGLLIAARDSEVATFDGTSWTVRNYGSTNQILAFCTDGVNYYAATTDGVWTAPIAGTATATKLWNLPSTSTSVVLGWSKQRLLLGYGPAVYVLEGTGPALPTAKFTHPLPAWAWTCVAESPNGIVIGGFAGTHSAIYRFDESDVSGVPTLGAPLSLLTLPNGEPLRAMLLYLGSFLVLATDKGIRVCPFSSYWGTVTLGPITTDWRNPTPFTCLGGFDRYIWGGTVYNGETQMVRVDLSQPLDQNGHYAWAPDLVFPTGLWTEAPTSLVVQPSGLKAIGVTGRGLVLEQDGDDASQPAWLQTARIRMGTVELKHWVYGEVRGVFSDAAPLGVSYQDETDTTTFASTYVANQAGQRFGLSPRASEWLALRFDLAEGSVLSSYQAQALPAGKRQRLVQIPVALTDFERTRSEVAVGYKGWALERLGELEKLESVGEILTVSAPALFPEALTGVIEKLTFQQTSDGGDSARATGGVLLIVIRTLS